VLKKFGHSSERGVTPETWDARAAGFVVKR
jgi:hypothetical protein